MMLPKLFIYPAMFTLGLLPPVAQFGETRKQKIREISFEGSYAFTTKRLLAIAGVKPGQEFRPEMTREIVSRIRRVYLERGSIKAEISVSERPSAQQAPGRQESVNLKVMIFEGPRYFVCSTEVIGNEMTNHGVVMRAAGLRLGPYNPSRIDKWVEGLNRLGRFEPVKIEDIVIDMNETEHCAAVRIQLKENPGLKLRTR